MRRFLLTSSLVLLAGPALATDYTASMQGYVDSGALDWMANAIIIDAVQAQNATTGGYTEDDILAMDGEWRTQVGTGDTPLIDGVLNGEVADFLRAQVEASGGMVTEIILMDAQGLNVAVSHVTSDYWQGDEAKHIETFGAGPDAVHFSEIELDESSQRYQGQISVTLVDPNTGEAIGAVTVGVDAGALG